MRSVILAVVALSLFSATTSPAQDRAVSSDSLPIAATPSHDRANADPQPPRLRKRGFLSEELLVGPAVVAGFPHFVNYSLEGLYRGRYGVGVTRGSLSVGLDQFGAGISNTELRLRHVPGERWLFYGVSVGRQSANVDVGHEIDFLVAKYAVPIKLDYDVESLYVTPIVGVGYTHRSGFHIGADVGWQFTRLQKEELPLRRASAPCTGPCPSSSSWGRSSSSPAWGWPDGSTPAAWRCSPPRSVWARWRWPSSSSVPSSRSGDCDPAPSLLVSRMERGLRARRGGSRDRSAVAVKEYPCVS